MSDFIVVDHFIDDYAALREHCDHLDYAGETNPEDGVFYPGVSIDIPESFIKSIKKRICNYFDRDCDVKFIFLRQSKEGVEAPHQAHTDGIMSRFALMLYLNNADDCLGGTSFLSHKTTGLCEQPLNDKQEKVWQEDTNNVDAWHVIGMCAMKPNRALIFDAKKMHRAEPIGGFGSDAKNSRLVLTCFFNLK